MNPRSVFDRNAIAAADAAYQAVLQEHAALLQTIVERCRDLQLQGRHRSASALAAGVLDCCAVRPSTVEALARLRAFLTH